MANYVYQQIMCIEMKYLIIPALWAGAVCLPLSGADWPQYRGPNHDGTSPEKISHQMAGRAACARFGRRR